MKRKKKVFWLSVVIFSAVISSAAFANYKSASKILLADNIEAMTSNEQDGIELEFCYKSSGKFGTTNYVCNSGSTFGSSFPAGTIYTCPSEKQTVSLFSPRGYCYKRVR